MSDFNKQVLNAITMMLDSLESNASFVRNPNQDKMINHIRQSLQSKSPIFVAEAGFGLGRKMAYLIACTAHAFAAGKSLVVSTYTTHSKCSIERDLELLKGVLVSNSVNVDIKVVLHSDFAENFIFRVRDDLPSPKAAVYVFDDAQRLEDAISKSSELEVSLNVLISTLNGFNSESMGKLFDSASELRSLFNDGFHSFFSKGNLLLCQQEGNCKRFLSDVMGHIDRVSFLSGKAALGCDEELAQYLLQVKSQLSKFSEQDVAAIPYEKWIDFDLGDYIFRAKSVSIERSLKGLWEANSGIVLTGSSLKMVDIESPTLMSINKYLFSIGLKLGSCSFISYEPARSKPKLDLHLPELPFDVNHDCFNRWVTDNLWGYCKDHEATFVLFNSRGAMEQARNSIEAVCTNNDFVIQCQGDRDAQAVAYYHQLALERGYGSIILGLSGYAEQLGELERLSNLVVTRIPFDMPDSPELKRKSEREQSMGYMPFFTLTLPKAAKELSQTVAQIVGASEQAVRCVVFDSRIVNSTYGHVLLDSLPPAELFIE